MFGDGEAIVRQGEPGDSMFIVGSGRAAVVLEPDGREVATIERGGYFGEMSLLTGEPRTATVVARGDTFVIEIDAEVFRRLGAASPQAVEQVGVAAATRRAELDQVRANASGRGCRRRTRQFRWTDASVSAAVLTESNPLHPRIANCEPRITDIALR